MAIHITSRRSPPSVRQTRRQPHARHSPRMPRLPKGLYRRHSPRGDRHVPAATLATPAISRNIALAGLELLIGYEWLVSGVDKLLYSGFPGTLSSLLASALSGGRLPSFFAALLRVLVMPNAVAFGFLIEWGEILAGLGLIAAGLVELLRHTAQRRLTGIWGAAFARGARLLDALAPFAAAGAGLLGLSFFLLDGLPSPWFTPSIAYGGALDTGLFLAAASVILLASRLAGSRR